uniref:Uncharacterized protein n=1 Tax=Cucumis melo TaxID=3656 RepID=A0A9I9CCP6_CUCME
MAVLKMRVLQERITMLCLEALLLAMTTYLLRRIHFF